MTDTPSDPRLVTEAAGESLDAIIGREGPLSEERSVKIATQVLDSLAAAHEAGVHHGALRAGHVLVGRRDAVKVSGYGVAPALSEGPREEASAPNDVRAVGLLLSEMLTGRPGATLAAGLAHDRVTRAIERALAANPQDRFQTAREMKKALGESLVKRAMDLKDDVDDAQDVVDLLKGKSGQPKASSLASRAKLLKLGFAGVMAAGAVIAAVTVSSKQEEPPPLVALATGAPSPARAPEPIPTPAPKPETAPLPEVPRPPEQVARVSPPPQPKAPKEPRPEPKPAPRQVQPPKPPPPQQPEPPPSVPEPKLELTALTFDQINTVMRTSIEAAARCVRPIPAGSNVEIPVHVALASDGTVRSAHMDHPKAGCIRSIVEGLRFPTFTRPSQAFTYTYRFR